MTPQKVISDAKLKCSEYLEMVGNPGEFIAWTLAHRVAQQNGYIEYLEKMYLLSLGEIKELKKSSHDHIQI